MIWCLLLKYANERIRQKDSAVFNIYGIWRIKKKKRWVSRFELNINVQFLNQWHLRRTFHKFWNTQKNAGGRFSCRSETSIVLFCQLKLQYIISSSGYLNGFYFFPWTILQRKGQNCRFTTCLKLWSMCGIRISRLGGWALILSLSPFLLYIGTNLFKYISSPLDRQ